MRGVRLWFEGLRSLGEHKLQSSLLVAGSAAGIAALMVVLALGKGTEQRVLKRVNNFGPRAIMLISGAARIFPRPT